MLMKLLRRGERPTAHEGSSLQYVINRIAFRYIEERSTVVPSKW